MAGPTTPFEDATGTDPAWTTLVEEATFLSTVVSGSGRVTKITLGQSAVDSNPMDLYAVGYPEPPTEAELRSKSNILILAMQHGDEPSGRDAALQYLRDLAYTTDVDTLKYLKAHPVMFIPTANPDGFPNSRENGNGVDLNRQWLSYSQAENQAIGKALRDYHPHILLDAHEMFDRTYQFEFLHPENPAIHPDIMSASLSLRNALMADATAEGYTNGLYPRDDQERVMSVNGCLQNIITILIEASGQSINSTLTRKDAVSAQVSLYGAAVSWHRENLPLVKSSVAAGRLGGLSDGDNQIAIERPSISSPPLGYRLTAAQFSSVQTSLDRMQLLSYPVDSSTDVYVPMAQANKRLLVNVVDSRASYNIVSATAEDTPPLLTAVDRVVNVRWRKQGGAVSGAETAVDADSLNVLSLDPTVTYEWSVQNQEASSTGDWSAWQPFTTEAQFNVQYRDVPTQDTTTVLGVSGTSLDVADLASGEQYEFRVQEDNNLLTSAWSDWHQFTTTAVGTDQDVTLVMGQQVTQAVVVNVDQVAVTNAIVASQQTQSQAATVEQIATLSSVDAQQATQAVSLEISTAAVMDITTVLLEQVTQTQVVTVDQVAQAAAVIAQQLTQGAPLSAEQVIDLAAVVVEQIIQSQAVDVSIVQPDDLTVAVIEQLTQAQSISANQSAQVTGLSAESRTQAQAAAVAAEYSLVAVTGEQITQAQAVEILDGTGLNVVTMEQATEAQAATVTLLALVNGIPAESLEEASTVATAATMLVTANHAQQLTEADIADILGSAMQLDPRELTITRTTAGFHVRRTTPTYRLQFKHSIH